MDPRKRDALKKFIYSKIKSSGINPKKLDPPQFKLLVSGIKRDFNNQYNKRIAFESEIKKSKELLTEAYNRVDKVISNLLEANVYRQFFKMKMKEHGISKLKNLSKEKKSQFFKSVKSHWKKIKQGK